ALPAIADRAVTLPIGAFAVVNAQRWRAFCCLGGLREPRAREGHDEQDRAHRTPLARTSSWSLQAGCSRACDHWLFPPSAAPRRGQLSVSSIASRVID